MSERYYTSPHRQDSTVPSKNVYIDNYRDSGFVDDYNEVTQRGSRPSFLRQNSIKNDRALVLRERNRQHTRTFSPTRDRDADKRIERREVVRERPFNDPSRPRSPSPVRSRERVRDEEIIIRRRSQSPTPAQPSPLKGVQVVLGPDQSSLNTTVHLELDIEGDVESHLEEFSRLKRLGHFHAAEQYFQSNLHDYLDVPPVAIEYAEMLLLQGAYKRLKELLLRKELTQPQQPRSRSPSPPNDRGLAVNRGTRGQSYYHDGRSSPVERTRTRIVEQEIVERERVRSPPPPPERVRARVVETRERARVPSPSPVRTVQRYRVGQNNRVERERSPSTPPPPPPRSILRERFVERERERSEPPEPDQTYSVKRVYQGATIESDAERFDLAFRLLESLSQVYSEGWLRRGLATAREAKEELLLHRSQKHKADESELSSTEVQIISCWQSIISCAQTRSNFLRPTEDVAIWSDWSSTYQSLREEGRIWDLGDVISSSLVASSTHGAERIWATFFNTDIHAPDYVDKFLQDWRVDQEYDEPTYLAILAILVDISSYFITRFNSPSETMDIATAKRCLEDAKRFAICIRDNSPRNIKSRPYLSWILVQSELERKLDYFANHWNLNKPAFYFHYLDSLPGVTVGPHSLPIYVPIKSENPGWPALTPTPSKSDELLQTTLKASQELGDYPIEVDCLRELICRSPQPKPLFERLSYVQKSLQGDMIGYLQTCLSKYFLATDEESRQSLIDELAQFDAGQPISFDIRDPLVVWSQRMVQAALYRASGRFSAEAEHADQMAKDLLPDLPDYLWSDLSKRGFQLSRNSPLTYPYTTRADIPDHSTRLRREYDSETLRDETRANQISREEEIRITKKELELHRLEQEKKAVEMKHTKEAEAKEIIEKYKQEENRKKEEEEEREKIYRARFQEDLQKSGLDPRQITAIMEKAKYPADPRPTYTRMSRRHLSLETLNRYRIAYELDQDPDYVLIKRWVPEYEQDFLWAQTKAIREGRGYAHTVHGGGNDSVIAGGSRNEDLEIRRQPNIPDEREPLPVPQNALVRKPERERRPPPSPSPPPSPPLPYIRKPPIHQEIITHHRHIDHGFEAAQAAPPPEDVTSGRSGPPVVEAAESVVEAQSPWSDNGVDDEKAADISNGAMNSAFQQNRVATGTSNVGSGSASPIPQTENRDKNGKEPEEAGIKNGEQDESEIQRHEAETSNADDISATKQPGSDPPKLKKRPTFAHVESVEDAEDVSRRTESVE